MLRASNFPARRFSMRFTVIPECIAVLLSQHSFQPRPKFLVRCNARSRTNNTCLRWDEIRRTQEQNQRRSGLSRAVARIRTQRGAHAVSRRDGPIPYLLLRQCHADCQTESRDIVLYLAGVNEHAALRIVGNKRWRVSHLLWTIQFFSI